MLWANQDGFSIFIVGGPRPDHGPPVAVIADIKKMNDDAAKVNNP